MSPFKKVLLISVILGLCTALLSIGYPLWSSNPKSPLLLRLLLIGLISIMGGVLIGGTLWGLLDLFTLKHIEAQSLMILEDRPVIFPKAACLWKWDKRFHDSSIFSYQEKVVVIPMIGPRSVTPNPKVRELTYSTTVKARGTPERCLAYIRRLQEIKRGLEEWLKYWLYEFNEAKSQEIAGFYNPCDDQQQSSFEKLVKEFLGPHIDLENTGLEFVSARFNLQ